MRPRLGPPPTTPASEQQQLRQQQHPQHYAGEAEPASLPAVAQAAMSLQPFPLPPPLDTLRQREARSVLAAPPPSAGLHSNSLERSDVVRFEESLPVDTSGNLEP